jgi:arylsulfatase
VDIDPVLIGLAAGTCVAQWLQSFREFPPRQKPGSFSLDRVMEKVSKPQGSSK